MVRRRSDSMVCFLSHGHCARRSSMMFSNRSKAFSLSFILVHLAENFCPGREVSSLFSFGCNFYSTFRAATKTAAFRCVFAKDRLPDRTPADHVAPGKRAQYGI